MAAATHPVTPRPSPGPESGRTDAVQAEASAAGERALVPAAHATAERGGIAAGSMLARLPVELELGVPVRGFRVRNLLALELGVVVASRWDHGEDLPLAAGNVPVAWTQFEVVETALAARITRLP